MSSNNGRPAWLEIDIEAIRYNIRQIAKLAADKHICAVIKANAYGHGAKRIAMIAEEEGCRMLAVATCDEAVELKKAGCVLPVLVLSPVAPEQYATVIRYDIRITLFDMMAASRLSQEAVKLNKQAKAHFAVDTGMSRIGVKPDESGIAIIKEMLALPNLQIEGIFTHFAAADAESRDYTLMQIARFEHFKALLEAEDIETGLFHACNSGGIIGYPQAYYDMVRPGILLYGYYPSQEVDKSCIDLKPALSIKALVTMVKEIDEGTCVSYGCRYVASDKRCIATLPIGYADGIPLSFMNGGEVLIEGKRAAIIGRICMDQMMVDVSDIPDCRPGTEVVLLGRQGNECIRLEEFSNLCGTIDYEILTGFNSRLEERYINE